MDTWDHPELVIIFRIRIEASFQSILPPIAGIPGKKYRQVGQAVVPFQEFLEFFFNLRFVYGTDHDNLHVPDTVGMIMGHQDPASQYLF